MSLILGNNNISKLYLDDTEISKVYLGGALLYSTTPPSYILNSDYIDIIGGVTVNNQGVATNFEEGNYLKFKQPFNPGNDSYEIVIKAQVGNGYDGTLALFGIKDVYSFVIGAKYYSSAYNVWASSNGTSWNLRDSGNYAGGLNSHGLLYWKLSYNSETNITTIETSTDGVSYSNVINYNSKLYFDNNCYLYISGDRSNTGNELGATAQVYLADSYYKIGTNNPVYFAISGQN